MRQPFFAAALTAVLAACGTTYATPDAPLRTQGDPPALTPAGRPLSRALSDFRAVAPRVERAAEAFCREELAGRQPRFCDF